VRVKDLHLGRCTPVEGGHNRRSKGDRLGTEVRWSSRNNCFNYQSFKFNIPGSVHRKYIPFDMFTTRRNITQFIYFCKTALHVSGGIFTHYQEHTQLYLQYLVLVNCNG